MKRNLHYFTSFGRPGIELIRWVGGNPNRCARVTAFALKKGVPRSCDQKATNLISFLDSAEFMEKIGGFKKGLLERGFAKRPKFRQYLRF